MDASLIKDNRPSELIRRKRPGFSEHRATRAGIGLVHVYYFTNRLKDQEGYQG
jgi:hypothetical protein